MKNFITAFLLAFTVSACGGHVSPLKGKQQKTEADDYQRSEHELSLADTLCRSLQLLKVPDWEASASNWPTDILSESFSTESAFQDFVLDEVANRSLAKEFLRQQELTRSECFILEQTLIIAAAKLQLERAAKELEIDDAALAELANDEYLANTHKYTEPGGLRVAHILLGYSEEYGGVPQKYWGPSGAQALRRKILDGEISFSAAARANSLDRGTHADGGEIKVLVNPQSQLVESFKRAALQLDPGEISEPVYSQFGIHLILNKEVVKERQLPFDDVREQIISEIKQQRAARQTEMNKGRYYPDLSSFNFQKIKNKLLRENEED